MLNAQVLLAKNAIAYQLDIHKVAGIYSMNNIFHSSYSPIRDLSMLSAASTLYKISVVLKADLGKRGITSNVAINV